MKKYNWHQEYFSKVLTRIGKYSLSHIHQGAELAGWYDYFKENHPEPFVKYLSIYRELNSDLWGKADSVSMERFKKLCKSFETAYKWAIDKYVEHLREEARKGEQVEMGI